VFYRTFDDAAGGVGGDSYTIAVAYREKDGRIVSISWAAPEAGSIHNRVIRSWLWLSGPPFARPARSMRHT
jgi:hypothetical protein